MAGTILHELSHFEDILGTTDDGGYNIKPIKLHEFVNHFDDWKNESVLPATSALPT